MDTMELTLLYPTHSLLIADGALLILRNKKGNDKTIPILSIQSVKFQAPTTFRRGSITLAIPKSPTGGFAVGGMMAAVGNEDEQFIFATEYTTQAQAIHSHIQSILSGQGSALASTTNSLADELLKLKSLLDAGALTETEFQTAKEKLLK